MDLLCKLQQLDALRQKLRAQECRHGPEFPGQLQQVYGVLSLREEMARCEYLCSEASLSLLPEYHVRCEVLSRLQYVDPATVVQLKGRVACEMGSNELIITELVFQNQLTDRPPAEIAALLSCMVFQQRNCSAPQLTPSLEAGIKDIQETAQRVGQVQVGGKSDLLIGKYDLFRWTAACYSPLGTTSTASTLAWSRWCTSGPEGCPSPTSLS
jgi:antiviral helicase SKI2